MTKPYSIAVFLLLCVIGTTVCLSLQDFYASGDFLLTIKNDDDDGITHISSLARYDPETGKFDNKFGGVYQEKTDFPISFIEYTHHGLFATGVFSFVGDKNKYCNSVARYTEEDQPETGELKSVGNGIWIEGTQAVKWIVGLEGTAIFAGVFNLVEDISLSAGKNVEVPSIAQYTKDGKWELLTDEKKVFPANPSIRGVATSPDGVGNVAFIYIDSPSKSLYTWTKEHGFNDVTPSGLGDIAEGSFVVDLLGNPAGIAVTYDAQQIASYSLQYIDASSNFQVKSLLIKDDYTATPAFPPTLLPYLDGFLVSIPQPESDFTKTTFEFFNSTIQEYHSLDIPALTFPIRDLHHIVTGDNGDIWASPIEDTLEIFHYTRGTNVWTGIELPSEMSVSSLTYDWDKKAIYGYGFDKSRRATWFTVVNQDGVPRNPGRVSIEGKILSSVVVQDDDDDGFTLWIGGTFSHVGKDALPARNIASWKDGEWTSYTDGTSPIAAMALYEDHTMFLSWSRCVPVGQILPLGYFPVDLDKIVLPSPFNGTFPKVVAGTGCVTAITTHKDEIFFGGNFTVELPGTTETATGVVHYNLTSGVWKGIGIPIDIGSSSDQGYQILSLTIAEDLDLEIDDVDVLLIGGHFEFDDGNGHEFKGFAAYSLIEGHGWIDVVTFTSDTIIYEILQGSGNKVYIAGTIRTPAQAEHSEGVVQYDFTNHTMVAVGALSNIANSILLATENADDDDDSNDEVTIYTAGSLANDVDKYNYPIFSYDFAEQIKSGKISNWTIEGSNIFEHFFLGHVNYLIYETGGSGEDGENGNAEPESSSGSGMSGWWITVIVFVCLGAVLVLVAAVAGGAFWFYKKKNSYQQID